MSSIDEFRRRKPAHLWPVALLRIYTGVFFLYYGFGKIRNPDFANGLYDIHWLERFVAEPEPEA